MGHNNVTILQQYKVQAVLQAKHNTELEAKDSTIEQLRTDLNESQVSDNLLPSADTM